MSNNFLDIELDLELSLSSNSSDTSTPQELIPVIELSESEIDPRLKLLSHSSRTMLHKCPRKYQIYRLLNKDLGLSEIEDTSSSITFAYGTAVGEGIASILAEKSEQEVILDTFLAWDTDLLATNPRQNKSIWLALFAVQKFLKLRTSGEYLPDWELVYFTPEGEDPSVKLPAVELDFQVTLPEGYAYRGFVDAVLQHKETGEVMVLECKTSSGTANATMYKNSGQAVGYSVVLDILFPELSAYTVLYLVYETKSYEYVQLPFKKSLYQRALWLQELLIDTDLITLYSEYGVFPMHGENCLDFFRDCEYLNICTLPTERLTAPLTQPVLDKLAEVSSGYSFNIDFQDLVDAQIAKGEGI